MVVKCFSLFAVPCMVCRAAAEKAEREAAAYEARQAAQAAARKASEKAAALRTADNLKQQVGTSLVHAAVGDVTLKLELA